MTKPYTPPTSGEIGEREFFDHWGVSQPEEGGLFEFSDVKDVDPHHVWTVVDDTRGGECALPGFHAVNVIGYVTTERVWTSKDISVAYWRPDEDVNGPTLAPG